MQHDARPDGPSRLRGRLIYLMGPSGSGKDSLIDHVRPALQVLGVSVARRVITRSAEAVGEDACSVSPQAFGALRAQGAFALDWQANGLCYGIPLEIDTWLEEGRSVLINGSRAHLQIARAKYPDMLPIMLTVSTDVLRERLQRRARETNDEIEQRLARNRLIPGSLGEDVRPLDNSTTLEDAAGRLLGILRGEGIGAG